MPGPMGGPPPQGGINQKAKNFKGTTKKLIKDYLSKYKIVKKKTYYFNKETKSRSLKRLLDKFLKKTVKCIDI